MAKKWVVFSNTLRLSNMITLKNKTISVLLIPHSHCYEFSSLEYYGIVVPIDIYHP